MAARLDVWLSNEVQAMSFDEQDFSPVRAAYPDLEIVHHRSWRDFEASVPEADLIDTWAFPVASLGLTQPPWAFLPRCILYAYRQAFNMYSSLFF